MTSSWIVCGAKAYQSFSLSCQLGAVGWLCTASTTIARAEGNLMVTSVWAKWSQLQKHLRGCCRWWRRLPKMSHARGRNLWRGFRKMSHALHIAYRQDLCNETMCL